MLILEQEQLKQEIKEFAESHGKDRRSLIPILQEIQRKYNHISEFAMQIIADHLGIHPVEVYGVVSFYSFLDEKPKGRFYRHGPTHG